MAGKQEDSADSTGAPPKSISLDQARDLAFQHARDNGESHGRNGDQEAPWDLVSADETGDHYQVRLSYRPPGSFLTSGVEQFTIGKTGSIASRQTIRQPRLTNGFIAASIAVVLLAVAGAVFGGLFAIGDKNVPGAINASSTQFTSISITPEAPSRLVSPDGEVAIDLYADTVSAPSKLAYTALSVAEIPVLPAEFTVTGKAFELTSETPLLKPITITVGPAPPMRL